MDTPHLIRRSSEHDIDLILNMFDHSRSVMRLDGNLEQWVGYPTRDDVADDIRRGVSFLVMREGAPVGTFALVDGEEHTYGHIDHGRWIDTRSPYLTLHRLAAMPGAHGIAAAAFAYAKERGDHLRADTHAANRPMHHILEREGFVRCGIVYMDDGGPRDAYEWWRFSSVPAPLRAYVEHEVLPRYRAFDAAHRADHARRVMARAMAMEPSPLVYAAAAMHDLGLREGRDLHHLASGRIIRTDPKLPLWFTPDEIELMAQAAEDHRASSPTPPRSRLGCIVAEADRDIEPETIVRRTVEYGLGHHPSLDREGHWQRTLEHLHEKYAEGGYLRLWMADSPNAAPLAELRALIADEPRLRTLFDHLYDRLVNVEVG